MGFVYKQSVFLCVAYHKKVLQVTIEFSACFVLFFRERKIKKLEKIIFKIGIIGTNFPIGFCCFTLSLIWNKIGDSWLHHLHILKVMTIYNQPKKYCISRIWRYRSSPVLMSFLLFIRIHLLMRQSLLVGNLFHRRRKWWWQFYLRVSSTRCCRWM